jgi:hypothetical protein
MTGRGHHGIVTTSPDRGRNGVGNFAVRVLEADLDKHGPRFVFIEFVASTVLCTLLALVVAVAAAPFGVLSM